MSREAYLKKYLSGGSSGGDASGDYDVAPVKRKKKPVGVGPKSLVARNAVTGAAGLKIIDESVEPDWRATAAAAAMQADEDGTSTRKSTFIDMRKRGRGDDDDDADDPMQPTRYIQVQRNDGSGWNSVDAAAPAAAAARVDSDGDADMSPRRRAPARGADRSPPRRARHDSPDRSPPRRARHDSPDASPPRRAQPAAVAADRDASPPRRKRRHDSPEPTADRSPPRRARAASPTADRSPPRRRARHDSPEPADRSPPRRARHASPDVDRSPPRRVRHDSPDVDRSPPRRARHDSPDRSPPRRARHDSPDADRSPPRRARHDSPEPSAGASSSAVAAPVPASASAAPKKGLILAADFQERNEQAKEKARADLSRLAAMEGGSGAPATVVRDKSGKRITLEEYEEQLAAERAAKESKPMEWASGLAQQVAAARAAEALQAERSRPFARTADDAELNAAQMGTERWGDPMLVAIRRAEAAAQAEALRAQQAAQERLLHKERKAARKEIKREKKELKRDKKKLLKQLDKQRRSDAIEAGGVLPSEASKEEQEKLVAELLAAKAAQLAEKKAALKAQKEATESKIALDLAAGGSGIVVSAARLAGPSSGGPVVREPRPMYRGHPWPNRYSILPGYRWDGVVRGIAWEDRIVRTANNRAHAKARGWKMGSEDM